MRTVAFLSILAVTSAQLSNEELGTCAVNGAEAVSDALDASMFIWASINRCAQDGQMVKCEIGVTSAITSVNSMINVILKTVDECGALETENKECGIAASELTKHAGGIAASSGMVVQKCTPPPAHAVNWQHSDAALCVVNVKNTAKSLFKMVRSFMKVKDGCAAPDSPECAANALQIVGAIAGLGEFLAGSIGKCSPVGANPGSVCAFASQRLVQQLTVFSERAIDVSEKCGAGAAPPAKPEEPAPGRLYSTKAKQFNAASNSNFLLAAFLPVTAIVGFVGGRVFGSRRTARNTQMLPVPDVE